MLFGIFIFQAEDGIRDYEVTGVQTCALPICTGLDGCDREVKAAFNSVTATELATVLGDRSEERRVGKECRARRSTEIVNDMDHNKNDINGYAADFGSTDAVNAQHR